MRLLEPTGADPKLFILDLLMIDMKHYGGLFIFNTPKPVIIETGFSHSLERIMTGLDEAKIDPKDVAYLMPTHIHMDHAGGAGYLAEVCTHAKVVCHEMGTPHLIDPTKLVKSVQRAVGTLFPYYGEMKPIAAAKIISVKGGENFDLGGGYSVDVVYTPGHAPHHVSFYERKTKGLFTGDAVGIYRKEATGYVMTTPPPSFNFDDSVQTLEMLKRLDLKWLYYTHYGAHQNPVALIDEYKNMLTQWVHEVDEKMQELHDEQAVKEYLVKKEFEMLADYYEPEGLKQETEMNVQGVLLYLQRRSAK
jgi:glyoxylase-like metal-dependent hydrolase (beta-lactamase superfamily II)